MSRKGTHMPSTYHIQCITRNSNMTRTYLMHVPHVCCITSNIIVISVTCNNTFPEYAIYMLLHRKSISMYRSEKGLTIVAHIISIQSGKSIIMGNRVIINVK